MNPFDPGDRTVIRDVCRITHHNDEVYAGALADVLAIRSALSGSWSRERSVLSAAVDGLPDSAVRDRIDELVNLQLQPWDVTRKFGTTGHVVDTVPLALYCAQFIASDPLADVLAQTIRIGGDTDTRASITGQLAGTVVGSAGMPSELVANVEGSREVILIAEAFAEFVDTRDCILDRQ